jgi:hypothetical protein
MNGFPLVNIWEEFQVETGSRWVGVSMFFGQAL